MSRMFAGATNGRVKYRDPGAGSWTDITISGMTGHTVRCMHAVSETSLWVGLDRLVASTGEPIVYHWDGSIWTQHLLTGQSGDTFVGGIWAVSDSEVYAATCIASTVSSGRLYGYNGISWSLLGSYSGRPSGIAGYDSSSVYVVYEVSADPVGVAKWNGSALTSESSGNGLPDGDYVGVGLVGTNEVYVVPGGGKEVYKGALGSWASEWDWSLDTDAVPSGNTVNRICTTQGTVTVLTNATTTRAIPRFRDRSGMWGKLNIDTVPLGGGIPNPGSPSIGDHRRLMLVVGDYYSGIDTQRFEDGTWNRDNLFTGSGTCSAIYTTPSTTPNERYFFFTCWSTSLAVAAFDVNAKLWINISPPGGFQGGIKYIHGSSKNDIWVGGTSYLGTSNLSAIHHFDGLKTWNEYLLPDPSPYGDSVFGLWVLSPDSAFAYQKHSNSSYGTLCHWDGISWTMVYLAGAGSTISAGSLIAFSTEDVYIAGGTNSEIGLWHWNGSAMSKSTTLPVVGTLATGPSKSDSEVLLAHTLLSVQANGIGVYEGSFDSWALDEQFTDTDIMSTVAAQPKIFYHETTGRVLLYSNGIYERIRDSGGTWGARTQIASGTAASCWVLSAKDIRAVRRNAGLLIYEEGVGWRDYPDTYNFGLGIGDGSLWGLDEGVRDLSDSESERANLLDLIETPELLAQSTQERWTSPIQGSGGLQEDHGGSLVDDFELPDIPSDSRQERWSPPLQQAGTETQKEDRGGPSVDTFELPDIPSDSRQERWSPPLQQAGVEPQASRGAVPDRISAALSDEPDYMEGVTDTDGHEFLGGGNLSHVAVIDTTVGGFGNPTTSNHWGAAKDGKFYADGVECAAGGFGIGSLNKLAWRFSGQDPFGKALESGTVSLVAPDTIEFLQAVNPGGWTGVGSADSLTRWRLQGDFDIQCDYSNYLFSASDANVNLIVAQNTGGTTGSNWVRLARGNYNYFRQSYVNGGVLDTASIGYSTSTFKLRLTRTGSNYQAYVDEGGGWIPVGGTWTHSVIGSSDVYVTIQADINNGTGSVRASNFTINAGTTNNHASWWHEASGDHRGTQHDMPDHLVAVCTNDSLDLVDTDTDKLWMRFIKGANLVLHNVDPYRPRRVRWDDGVLYLAFGSNPTDSNEGSGILIDFTTEYVRLHRESGSTVCGGFFAGNRELFGGISRRNTTKGYTFDDDTWQTPQYRHFDVGLYRNSGYEYHANATGAGMAMFKWQRWYWGTNWGSTERSTSTETGWMRACHVDQSTGELFYMDSSNLYSAFKGGGSGWEDAMDGGTFTAATTKALPGSRLSGGGDYQYTLVKFGPYVFVPADEGVYRVDWPSGAWELFYGKASETSATHDILPDYDLVTSIELTQDGGVDLLVIGLRWDGGAYSGDSVPLPAQIVVVRLDTNVIWGIEALAAAIEAPRALAI